MHELLVGWRDAGDRARVVHSAANGDGAEAAPHVAKVVKSRAADENGDVAREVGAARAHREDVRSTILWTPRRTPLEAHIDPFLLT